MKYDLKIVGSGLTGATIARLAKDEGFNPLVLERRGVVGGNVRDEIHEETGLRYGLYGPHYFRTNSDKIISFVSRFAKWKFFEAEVQAFTLGRFWRWPLTKDLAGEGFNGPPTNPENFTNVCLHRMSLWAYKTFVQPYTEKQWGISADSLSGDLAQRIEIRADTDLRLKTDKFQAIPVNGYSAFVEKMLEGIEVRLNDDSPYPYGINQLIIYTGPIDEFFDFQLGRLRYRSQRRDTTVYSNTTDSPFPAVQVNFPSGQEPIRAITWNYVNIKSSPDWLVTYETPQDGGFEYPMPLASERQKYQAYELLAKSNFPQMIFAGRLGEYRYLDMDQAIARAMMLWEKDIQPKLKGVL